MTERTTSIEGQDRITLSLTQEECREGKISLSREELEGLLDQLHGKEVDDFLLVGYYRDNRRPDWNDGLTEEEGNRLYQEWSRSGQYQRVELGFRYRDRRGYWQYEAVLGAEQSAS